MLKKLFHLTAAAGLLLGLLGCSSGVKEKITGKGQSSQGKDQQGEQGGQSKAQSAGGPSELDKELKRQGDIYREFLKHNAESAEKHREADRKLLRKMEKNQQEVRQHELKILQEKQGLTGSEEEKQGKQDSSGKDTDKSETSSKQK